MGHWIIEMSEMMATGNAKNVEEIKSFLSRQKENFNTILGRLVYKPKGKLTLVPDTDKREAISTSSAAADFEEV